MGEAAYLIGEIDGATALALLEWQVELGADEAILDEPQDRFLEVAPASANPALPKAAKAAPAQKNLRKASDFDLVLQDAKALAASAANLQELATAQQSFDGLTLKRGARNFCFADGRPDARVMIIGEAPSDEDDVAGKPFSGAAGKMLDRMFEAIGLTRDNPDAEKALYLVNALPWHPPGDRLPNEKETALSLPFLQRHIELADPDVLVLMGNAPCMAMLGRSGLTRLRGNWTECSGRPALPMMHPAALLQAPMAKREAWADLLSLAAHLAGRKT